MLTKKCEVCGAKISRKSKICPYCNEKPNKVSVTAIRTFFLWFILLMVIGTVLFGTESTESDGTVFSPPEWYFGACYVIPTIVAVSKINRIKKGKSKGSGKSLLKRIVRSIANVIKSAYQKKVNPNNDFIVPKTKKRQGELAAQLIEQAKINVQLANESDDIRLFAMFYDDALDCLKKLSLLNKVSFENTPQYELLKLQRETQWHLCDALSRQKEKVLLDIKGKYRNSREFQEKQYESFKDDIAELRSRFSEKTDEFACECLRDIEKVLGLNSEPAHSLTQATCGDMASIDFMEGHEFEHWCANLLRKIGFINVEVTQESGDQGVDILAEKDGIKYAIQCKCYSSNLGNKPVQEVNTGKLIYHCQIGAIITNRYFTQGGKEAAAATGVLLWDRDWIKSKLEEITI